MRFGFYTLFLLFTVISYGQIDSMEIEFIEESDSAILEDYSNCQHKIKERSSINSSTYKTGIFLLEYTVRSCDIDSALSEHMDRIVEIYNRADTVVIGMRVYINCCSGTEAEVEMTDSTTWNLLVSYQKDSCVMCMSNCWHDLKIAVQNNTVNHPDVILFNNRVIPFSATPIDYYTIKKEYYSDGSLMFISYYIGKTEKFRIKFDQEGNQVGIEYY